MFAEAACGDATVMLNGSIATPFDTSSVFGSVEVLKLNSTKVRKLTVVLVTATTPVSDCSNESLQKIKAETGQSYHLRMQGSERFAEAACGDATVMLNGSIATPFDTSSVFGSVEVLKLNSTKVRKLTVVLVTATTPVSDCSNESLQKIKAETGQSYHLRMQGSERFAEAACGDATVMLNGSIATPFDTSSVFGSVEVLKLNSTKVRKLTVVLVTATTPVSDCSNESLQKIKAETGQSYHLRMQGSERFAEAACGDATVMLNGSIATPFDTSSVFGSVEVLKLNSTKVRKLTVVLVTATTPVSDCSNESLQKIKAETGQSYHLRMQGSERI
ncbi:uncharacterized protein isoform X2 [Takifugu rubripes]|uniref:uncharacterized protein isoform X2 n=1 Tax=Takifugu rubripes TaxID=31033 RepID=UPI00114577AB|nr:uncharacterized protein LOC115251286 isoform X2 [Takifugu rubripes]